nr:MAG TPA: hypothetical protein [Caudoviricetes sp.]
MKKCLHYRISCGNIHTSADNTNRRKHDKPTDRLRADRSKK